MKILNLIKYFNCTVLLSISDIRMSHTRYIPPIFYRWHLAAQVNYHRHNLYHEFKLKKIHINYQLLFYWKNVKLKKIIIKRINMTNNTCLTVWQFIFRGFFHGRFRDYGVPNGRVAILFVYTPSRGKLYLIGICLILQVCDGFLTPKR